jgi:Flp pilus assembly protein TadD
MLEGAEIGARRILADYAGAPCARDAQVMLDRITYIKPSALPYGSLNTPSKQALFSGRAAINRNMFDSARLYFSRVAQLSPSAREGKEAAAWIKWMDEHPGQARAKPNSAAVLGTIVFQTGLALDRAGQKEAARTAYQQTIRAYPNTPAASAAAQMLAKL